MSVEHRSARRSRRKVGAPEPARRSHKTYRCGDVVLDVDERVARIDGERILPTYGEFEVLLRLIEDPGRVFSRNELQVHTNSAGPRAVDVQIRRLRVRLARARHFAIETVQHLGYRCAEF